MHRFDKQPRGHMVTLEELQRSTAQAEESNDETKLNQTNGH